MKLYPFKHTIYNCKQATLLIIKKTERGLTMQEKLKLSCHLLFCNPCRNFSKQSPLIDQLLKHYTDHLSENPTHSLSTESKNKIEQAISSQQ